MATFCAYTIYQLVPIPFVKSDMHRSIESLIINMCTLVYTLDKAYSFYIYTLASGYFRKQLKQLTYSFFRRRRVMP